MEPTKDEIVVVSSRNVERGLAFSMLVCAFLFLGYALLTPGMIDWIQSNSGLKAKVLFILPFFAQKIIGFVLAVSAAWMAVKQWRNASDGRFILKVDRDGIHTNKTTIPWSIIVEIHFYANGYIVYAEGEANWLIRAAGSSTHRDDVLEVVKRVKAEPVRLEYFDKQLPSVVPKLAAAGGIAGLLSSFEL